MAEIAWIPLLFVTLLVLATIGLGIWVQRSVRSTADMYVASRAVSVPMNSAAISGEYLSAASFMGVAGMVMKFGYDVLWYPTLYAVGYRSCCSLSPAPCGGSEPTPFRTLWPRW